MRASPAADNKLAPFISQIAVLPSPSRQTMSPPSTAHEHFETAKKKLKTSTRAEAIALAVSLAIVAP